MKASGIGWLLGFATALAAVLATGCSQPRAGDPFAAPIRPGVPGKSPFWNAQAKQFIAPPAFGFEPVAGAKVYRFTIECSDGSRRSFEGGEPWAPMTPVWRDVPAGKTKVLVEGLDRA